MNVWNGKYPFCGGYTQSKAANREKSIKLPNCTPLLFALKQIILLSEADYKVTLGEYLIFCCICEERGPTQTNEKSIMDKVLAINCS